MNKKKIWRICMLLGLIGFISFFEVKKHYVRKNYYESSLKTKIIRLGSNISAGRSYDYITKSGVIITLMNSDTLFIGDSIVKEKNNWVFELYRKNKTGNYKFVSTYNLDK